jgi:hypothetical protein
MRSFPAAGIAFAVLCGATLHASIIPILHLDNETIGAFENYVIEFEKTDMAPFASAGKLWIDGQCCGRRTAFDTGRTVLEPRRNEDVANGSIHHVTGMIRVEGGSIEAIRRVMEDYPNYPRYFPPDVVSGRGEQMADSTPADEHFRTTLVLSEQTLWIKVGFRCQNDTHYRRLDADHWISRSVSLDTGELIDPDNPAGPVYPDGNNHGFLWKTNTYWFARQRKGGVDIELNTVTLSRPAPLGFGWWGAKRTKDAVDKMLRDVKAAMMSAR